MHLWVTVSCLWFSFLLLQTLPSGWCGAYLLYSPYCTHFPVGGVVPDGSTHLIAHTDQWVVWCLMALLTLLHILPRGWWVAWWLYSSYSYLPPHEIALTIMAGCWVRAPWKYLRRICCLVNGCRFMLSKWATINTQQSPWWLHRGDQ